MIRARARLASALALALGLTACSGQSQVAPRSVAPGELTLRYNDGMVIYAGHEPLTRGPGYRGLEGYVRCVPRAAEHARYARRYGRARKGLAWAGGTLGVASLGSLGGFALFEEDRSAAFAILGVGLGVAIVGIVLAGASRSAGNQAHGNAIDALNYYNDAVGSLGGSCARPAAPAPRPAPLPGDPPPPVLAPTAAPARDGEVAPVEETIEIEGPAPLPVPPAD
ncbi:MAG: hypothetical protein R3B09_21785 [Nannocystaceae bacterium]